jgi:hypothetical protein
MAHKKHNKFLKKRKSTPTPKICNTWKPNDDETKFDDADALIVPMPNESDMKNEA